MFGCTWQITFFALCIIHVKAQNFGPIAVSRPENGRPFEPAAFRESVAKAIRERLRADIDAPVDTNAQQNFNIKPAITAGAAAARPNAIQRIRVPILKKVAHQKPLAQPSIEEYTTTTTTSTTTTRRPYIQPQQKRVVQQQQNYDYEDAPAVVRQPIHTPIIPKTPQVFRKDDTEVTRKRTRFDEDEDEQARSAQYSFSSNIDDSINDNQMSRSEARDGLAVTGMYSYSDGFFKRTVHYIADENGYRVVKEDIQPVGDGPQYNPDGRADVSSSLAGRYSITADDYKQPSRKDKEERRRHF